MKELIKLHKENKLGSAYIFFSDDKQTLKEKTFALVSNIEGSQNLGDTYTLKLKEDENSIGIGDVRDAKKFLSMRPSKSPRRTLVIEDGEFLTDEAQNALLKIIEDSPSQSLIIILAKHKSLLLDTINSRMQSIFIKSENSIEIKDEANVKKFLSGAYPKDFIKTITEGNTKEFLNNLINYLSLDIKKNSSKIKKVLEINTRINELSVNKKLQLEALSEDIKQV